MLNSLLIKDFALIEKLRVEFTEGLNIITGETGAGKSIIIGALGLLLGERASVEVVRKGSDKSIVEGIFNITDKNAVTEILKSNDIDFDDELILRREISLKGSNRCFVNDSPVTLNIFKEIGDYLIDIHGQHDHQSLLRTETHIKFLDEFGNYSGLIEEFTNLKNDLQSKIGELKKIKDQEALIKEKKELYEFQMKEIDSVSPHENEDEEISRELNILENTETLMDLAGQIYNSLYESEYPVYNELVKIDKLINELSSIDNTMSEKASEFSALIERIDDIADSVRKYNDKIELDPERLNYLRERLVAINRLKKKFGGSVVTILQYREKIGEEFDLAENFAERIENLNEEILIKRKQTGKTAVILSEERKKIALTTGAMIVDELKELGIQETVFETRFDNIKGEPAAENYLITDSGKLFFNNNGIDEVEFYISTNKGEDPKPLAKVASGGEISRIMLALKTILAKNEKLPLLIFDEIDTGVSGRIASKVGQSLKNLARFHQVICITHLPQIAALADSHFQVEKELNGERVTSRLKLLSQEERIEEIAKMMSGEEVNHYSLENARQLMNL